MTNYKSQIPNQKSFDVEFRRFLWSSILIALSACLGNVVDAVIVGNLIGEDGVSAINLSKPVTQFMFTISMLLSTGAGMLVGMELGKKDHDRAASFFTFSTASCLAFGLLMTLCGLFATAPITGWLCKDPTLYVGLHDYLFPMLLGAPMYMASWALATMVGVDGSPRLVSIAILIDNAVNLFLDIVFIKWLGWCYRSRVSCHLFLKDNSCRNPIHTHSNYARLLSFTILRRKLLFT